MENKQQPLPTTSDLFQKHFGETASVNLKHPGVENFFNELNEVCKEEDRRNAENKQEVASA